MELEMYTTGANSSTPNNITTALELETTTYAAKENLLPVELREISTSNLHIIRINCVIFVIAASGNLILLNSLWKQYKIAESRITLLLLHLSLADLIVCCTVVPTEVLWRITIQWRGGNILCKFTQFSCAFGLYLSSLVLICVSVDRFLAIMFPLTVMKKGAHQRIQVMLATAWILATVFSLPQLVFFGLETHPDFPAFEQCVSSNFLNNSSDLVTIYSIFALCIMYFLPLLVIVCTCTAVAVKLVRKSRERSRNSNQPLVNRQCETVVTLNKSTSCRWSFKTMRPNNGEGQRSRTILRLRCSDNAKAHMSKAKSKTLLMTLVIIFGFLISWSPYAFMTMWYMVDWQGARKVDPRVQDVLFLMAVANSCVNPLIYGTFRYRKRR